jgi:hypothetical protein
MKQVENRACSMVVSCLAYFSTLKMEATYFETSVDSQCSTQLYIPEDGIHNNHRCENLKSYIKMVIIKYLLVFQLQQYMVSGSLLPTVKVFPRIWF